MDKNSKAIGHILALFTALVWGMTLVSTKILLKSFTPVEILFSRFLLATFALYLSYPKKSPKISKKDTILIILAGLFGITFYYMFENIALTYTLASNVGVINCCAPFFTAILAFFFMKDKEKISLWFMVGFLVSILGISLIAFNGAKIHLNPLGDLLAVFAAISWAIYSILIKKLASSGLSTIFITRKSFFFGTLFMIPFLFIFDFHFGFSRFLEPQNTLNLLFLGLGASALCFATWNKAIKILGALKSSVYIYLIPVITVLAAVSILGEPMTNLLILGTIITLSGLLISEKR